LKAAFSVGYKLFCSQITGDSKTKRPALGWPLKFGGRIHKSCISLTCLGGQAQPSYLTRDTEQLVQFLGVLINIILLDDDRRNENRFACWNRRTVAF